MEKNKKYFFLRIVISWDSPFVSHALVTFSVAEMLCQDRVQMHLLKKKTHLELNRIYCSFVNKEHVKESMTCSSPIRSEERKLELGSNYNHSAIRADLIELNTHFNAVSCS